MCEKDEEEQNGHGAKCGELPDNKDPVQTCELTVESFIFCFIQDQYTFVYDAVLEATLVGDTVIPAHEFQETYTKLKKKDRASKKTMLSKQYEVWCLSLHNSFSWFYFEVCYIFVNFISQALTALIPVRTDVERDGLKEENMEKNRDIQIVPREI